MGSTSLISTDFFLDSFPVVDMETSQGLLPSGQTVSLLQSPELCNISTEVFQMRTPPVNVDRLLTAPVYSSSKLLTLPLAPSLEQRENENMLEMKAELSMPRDAYEGTKGNQGPSHLPLVHPDCTDTRSLRPKSASDNASMEGISVGLEEQEKLENKTGSRNNFNDITTLGAGDHLPQFFKTLKDIDWGPPLQSWRVMSSSSENVTKNDLKASDLLDGAPQAKIQHQDLVRGEGSGGCAKDKERAIDNISKHLEGKAPKEAPSRHSRARKQGQEKPSGPENNSKKTQELKQSRNRVKAEEKPTIPKTKRKRNPPELSQNSFKKPRTHLGMHMLESVQVFHRLGKKIEKKTGISSFRDLRTFTSNKDPGPGSGTVTTTVLNMPCEGQGPPKSPGKVQRAESSVDKDCLSPSQYELPPAGKVRLVPLPFPTLDKPQSRPASRKPLSLALRRPTTVYPVQPHSLSSTYHS